MVFGERSGFRERFCIHFSGQGAQQTAPKKIGVPVRILEKEHKNSLVSKYFLARCLLKIYRNGIFYVLFCNSLDFLVFSGYNDHKREGNTMQQYGYIGTYTTGRSEGIYQFQFDTETGMLSNPVLFAAVHNPKSVAHRGNILASAIEQDGKAGVAIWDTRALGQEPLSICCPEQQTPCHVRFSGSSLLTANYHEGLFTVYRMDSHQLSCARQIACGSKAGCHQSLARRGFMLVPCLEQDQVRIFDRKFSPRGVILFPQGSGPRHGVFNPKDRTLWIVTERSHELYHFAFADTRFQQIACIPILPADDTCSKSTTAAIRLSLDRRFLYVSTRGADIMSVFALEGQTARCIQQVPCGGKHPRDFVLSEDGRFALVLCRDSDDLFSIAIDPETGLLGQTVCQITVPEGSSICL